MANLRGLRTAVGWAATVRGKGEQRNRRAKQTTAREMERQGEEKRSGDHRQTDRRRVKRNRRGEESKGD